MIISEIDSIRHYNHDGIDSHTILTYTFIDYTKHNNGSGSIVVEESTSCFFFIYNVKSIPQKREGISCQKTKE